jgi:two-component system cell cycle sensor histidine kinase/response regulator CckA
MTHSLLSRPDRLAALRQTGLVDTPPEEGFDRLTRMAARLLGASTALISLVTQDRQFFKSAIGLPEPWASSRTAPLSFSFCSTVVGTGEPLVVEDARRHPLLRHSPAIRELGWVSYAGVPLMTRDGQVVGSLSVVDKMPRLWSERDLLLLQDLAASAVTEIELRRETALRHQAELGRRGSEETLYHTFEQVGIGMALISPDGRWLRLNRAMSEMLGVSGDDLVGFPAEANTHPDDLAADREATRLLLAGECRTYTMEKRFLKPSGEVVWGLVNVSLVAGTDGNPAHFIAAIQDISELKRNEARLRAQDERYRLAVQASGAVVRDWELATDRLTWDRETGPLLDYQPSELGESADWWYQRIHPSDRERVVASIDSAIGQGHTEWAEEYGFLRAGGSYAVLQDRARIVRDVEGKPLGVVGAMEDVTTARQPAQELGQAFETLPVGTWLLDREGRIVLANSASMTIWGETPDNVARLNQYHAWWTRTGQLLRPEEWGPARALQAGESSVNEEIVVETPDGLQKTIQVTSLPLRDPNGEITGAVVLSEDISGNKARAAEELERAGQQYESQKMDAIGRLAGGIAHDFNNLLTGILSYSDLILQELRPDDPLRADVEQIKDAGQRAAGVTRQLLAFSRRQLLQPRVVSLNATVTELEPMFQRLLGTDVTLVMDLDPMLGSALVDPAQMERVLVNLVLNAREAMPSGGQLRITTANVDFDPTPDQRDNGARSESYVSITVADTGIGMDAETQARIFEPFFTTKQAPSGRGLGLSTVYGIVEQSGGYITVLSAPGEGAGFTLYLPRYWGPEVPVGTAQQRRPEVGTETLLLVEDEAAVRASVRRLLEWHGYTVLEARNGADALRVYEAHEEGIDLVLTDVVMPEMGGHELVERLRALRPGLRVLFMSGYAERAFASNGAIPPGMGFVEKPFTVETLMRRLREVLDA